MKATNGQEYALDRRNRIRRYFSLPLLLITLLIAPSLVWAEFTDITGRIDIEFDQIQKDWKKQVYNANAVLTNVSDAAIGSPVRLVVVGYRNDLHYLANADGIDSEGYPYIDFELPNGALGVGETSDTNPLQFKKRSGNTDPDLVLPPIPEDAPWVILVQDFPIKFYYSIQAAEPPVVVDPIITISAPDSQPYAISPMVGDVEVLFTTSVSTNVDGQVGTVVLRNLAQQTQFDLNDDGINGDLEAGDGVYSSLEVIDTNQLQGGQCHPYVGIVMTPTGEEITSLPYDLCITNFPKTIADSNTNPNNHVQLGDAIAVSNEILVWLEPGILGSDFRDALWKLGAYVVGTLMEDQFYQVRFNYGCGTKAEYDAIAAQIEEIDGVIRTLPNYIGTYNSVPNDPEFLAGNQHGLELVSANNLGFNNPKYVWDAGATGRGTQVLLLDSGVDPNHPENIDPRGELPSDFDDVVGHGTEMAGIIRASTDNQIGIAAMARDSRIRTIRVSNSEFITLAKILEGFKRARLRASRNKVVSASFSINNVLSDGGVCKKIDQIISRGAVVVVSAGNNNSNAEAGIVPANCNSPAFDPFTYPSPVSTQNKRSLIVVGASACTSGACANDSRWSDSAAVGSNFGSWVDISAPGVDVATTTILDGYTTTTGTSAATALVAGAAAILRGCEIGGALRSSDSSDPTLGLDLRKVFNAMSFGATTAVSGLPNRLNLYHSLASFNSVPGGISIDNRFVDEGVDTSGGFRIGNFSADDGDTCDAHSFAISGGADADKFSLRGANDDRLFLDDGVLDFDRQSSYEVRIRVTDFFGETYARAFIIRVNDLP